MFQAILFLSAKERELSATDGIRKISPSLYSLENLLESLLKLFEFNEVLSSSIEIQKEIVINLLEDYRTLLVLDNMETVSDGRITQFIQELPTTFKGKVLLTSRRRTDSWENAIKIEELSNDEVERFIKVRSNELEIDNSLSKYASKRREITGGLPLAIQWTLGRYKVKHNISEVLDVAVDHNSPLLEFSFGNLWQDLDNNSKQALAVLSIFESSPTKQEWRTSLDWSVERLDKAIDELQNMTLVREEVDTNTGSITYHSLPITLTFGRNKLREMNGLEREARTRHQEHIQSMQLVAQETDRYTSLFQTYDAKTENQKKAIILSRMADSQEELGPDAAEEYYRQALDLEPRSIYVLVKFGRFLVDLGRIGEGLEYLEEATKRCNKRTGFFAFYNLALTLDKLRERERCKNALEKALQYDPTHLHARHLYGVVLSRLGERGKSIEIFEELIQEELNRPSGPTRTLIYALKTKLISLQKLERTQDAELFRQEAIAIVNKYSKLRYLVHELEEI